MAITVRRTDGLPLPEPEVTITEVSDPAEASLIREALAAAKANQAWLSEHWPELMPQARGKHVVVANQAAHLADSVEGALAWADAQSPRDPGRILRYVSIHERPRIYANRG